VYRWRQFRSSTETASGSRREVTGSARKDAFCATTIQGDGLFVVENTEADSRFADNLLVTGDPHVRFYAGYPIMSDGQRVGALCIMDTKPHELTPIEEELLQDIALWVQEELTRTEERDRASEVQRALLPQQIPELQGYEIAGDCVPSRSVGGDFYDWYFTRDGRFIVTVADVMGKGMAAAMVMATVRAVLKSIARKDDFAEAIGDAALALESDLDRTQSFVAVFDARLTPATGDIEYVDAGLGLGFIVHPEGTLTRLSVRGMPIGAFHDATWESGTTRLEPGDTLLVMSDGIFDAYGGTTGAFAQLTRFIRPDESLATAIDNMIADATPRVVNDDVTVVAVRRHALIT
jgi:serine phosphatase RsbU (regulator of sigma subunit)